MSIPQAPFYGSRVVEDISLDDVFSFVNETALFKGQWQFKQGRTPLKNIRHLVRDKVRPIYEELKERSASENSCSFPKSFTVIPVPVGGQRSDRL